MPVNEILKFFLPCSGQNQKQKEAKELMLKVASSKLDQKLGPKEKKLEGGGGW